MRFLPAVAAWGLTFAPALAAAPAWQAGLTPFNSPAHPRLAPCALEYRASWKGLLDAGKIRIEFGNPANAKGGSFVATSHGESTGPASALFDFKSWYWSEMESGSLRPKIFHSVEDLEKRRVTYHLDYSPKGVDWSRNTRIFATGFQYDTKGAFAFTPVHDLFSSMLFVRGRKLDNGDTVSFVIQPGDDPYLVNAHVDNREAHDGRSSIRLTVKMLKIDTTSLALLPYKKLKEATLWLSDDADRIPLEIRAGVFIGDVRVTLAGQAKY
ncbi:DUF3108 domain-containing protein [Luteolibacter sp. LG18]|uniref:DUF3108 domain-containing protein n=1 Tax=Luteolibacter sp. LG18 TaxID=2819286 RepID=UPI0030C74C4E